MTDKNEPIIHKAVSNDPISDVLKYIKEATDPEIQARKADKISLYWEKTGSFTDISSNLFSVQAG
jgi:hypothetical protein